MDWLLHRHFLQACLWFGLLRGALDIYPRTAEAPNRVSIELFAKTIEDWRHICNNHLLSALLAEENRKSSERNTPHLDRITSYIHTIETFIAKIIKTPLIARIAKCKLNTQELQDVFRVL